MADLARRPGEAAAMRRTQSQDRAPRTEYLAFSLAGDVYAAPVALIREILKPPPLTPVPRAPHEIMGIVSVRGQLVTVVDLRRRLRLAEPPASRRARILLATGPEGETLGLYVDEVLQVYRLTESEIEPAATALGGDAANYIVGIARPTRASGAAGGARGARQGARGGRQGAHLDDYKSPLVGPDASVVILLDLRAVLAF